MNPPLWVSETAQRFWQLAGREEPFPRSLRRPIADALPLAVVSLPVLHLARIESWLRCYGIVCAIGVGDRPLRASLVAHRGYGILFLDATDEENEQRFSLAHELAHFLRHYWRLRQRVNEQLGPAALQVLDGERPPTRAERMDALLAGVQIGSYIHLMDRAADRTASTPTVDAAEREADHLAYELLAPAANVLKQMSDCPPAPHRQAVEALLVKTYGLPAAEAAEYATLLVGKPAAPDSFVRRLGFAP